MKRSYYLHGTNITDRYGTLSIPKDLSEFLKEINSASDVATINTVRSYVCPPYPKFDDGNILSKSTEMVIYAPMHLDRLKTMPKNIKSFSAVGITGLENKPGRDTQYGLTVFIPSGNIQNTVNIDGIKYNYLDQLFGCRNSINWVSVKRIREGDTKELNFSEAPQKVTPGENLYKDPGINLVINCCKAIYEGKAAVILLDNRTDFNAMPDEILKKIYSLLPANLAFETGYASLIDPNLIVKTIEQTSIKLFVLPEGLKDKLPSSDKYVLFDTTNPSCIPQYDSVNNLERCLYEWTRYKWNDRCNAMELLFKDVQKFNSSDIFVERSNKFFDTDRSFNKWIKDGVVPGGLDKIKEKFDSFAVETGTNSISLLDLMPGYISEFNKKIGNAIDSCIAEEIKKNAQLTDEEAEKKKERTYNFLRKLDGITSLGNSTKFYGYSLKNSVQIKLDRKNQELEQINGDYKNKLSAQAEQYKKEINSVINAKNEEIAQKKTEITLQAETFNNERIALKQALNNIKDKYNTETTVLKAKITATENSKKELETKNEQLSREAEFWRTTDKVILLRENEKLKKAVKEKEDSIIRFEDSLNESKYELEEVNRKGVLSRIIFALLGLLVGILICVGTYFLFIRTPEEIIVPEPTPIVTPEPTPTPTPSPDLENWSYIPSTAEEVKNRAGNVEYCITDDLLSVLPERDSITAYQPLAAFKPVGDDELVVVLRVINGYFPRPNRTETQYVPAQEIITASEQQPPAEGMSEQAGNPVEQPPVEEQVANQVEVVYTRNATWFMVNKSFAVYTFGDKNAQQCAKSIFEILDS